MRGLTPTKAAAFLKVEYFGNALSAYLWAALVFLGVLFGFLVARDWIIRRLRMLAQKTATDLDDLAVELLAQIRTPECYLVALYLATRGLELPGRFDSALRVVTLLVVAYRLVRLLSAAANYSVRRLVYTEGDASRRSTANALSLLAQGVIWTAAALFVLSNLGFNISSLIAGLGIGGVAVALAAQAVLADLFAAFAIFLDRPFEVGDYVTFDGGAGTIERIGVKTTQLRSLSGEQLIVGNAKLTTGVIGNFGRMSERRVPFTLGVTYGTSEEKLAAVPGVVKALIEKDPALRFERGHLMGLGDSSLDFEFVYWVKDADYNKHMDSKQRLLLGIVRELRARGVDFAFPTRTVVLEQTKAA
jgi:small-conductance mechanosensitive channel